MWLIMILINGNLMIQKSSSFIFIIKFEVSHSFLVICEL